MVDSLEIVSAGKILHVRAMGKLTKESYEKLLGKDPDYN